MAAGSYIGYILDVLALCLRVDSSMSEAGKVGHILKAIANDAFNLLVVKHCSAIDEIIKCWHFEGAKSRRFTKFMRLPNTAAMSSYEDIHSSLQPSTPESVLHIVWHEIEAMSLCFFVRHWQDTQSTISLIQADNCNVQILPT